MNFSPQTVSNWTDSHFYPPYINSAFCFIARLRRWRSANGTRPNFAKRWTVNRANNPLHKSRGRPSQKLGAKETLNVCSVYDNFWELMPNIFWKEHDIANWSKALESTKGLLRRLKISWTLVHKRLKIESEFLATLRKFCVLLRCHSKRNTTICQMGGGNWRWCEPNKVGSIVDVNETTEIVSMVSRVPRKHFKLAMASHRAAFSGNTSLIATFSSYLYLCQIADNF